MSSVTGCTVHLIGPGKVGRALLPLLNGSGMRVIGATDSTATIHSRTGLDGADLAAFKASGGHLSSQPASWQSGIAEAALRVAADVVVDTSATRFDRQGWAADLDRGVLARGAVLALAAKDPICVEPGWWQNSAVGCNAALGGTGHALRQSLPDLRGRCRSAVIAGNASTSAIIGAIERGGSFEDGIAVADRLGYLEPDPELDLRGVDAAVKLAIVAGALLGRAVDPATIPCQDIRDLDIELLRVRARRGATTRLLARFSAGGALTVGYEQVARGSILDVPAGRVAYVYEDSGGAKLIHLGTGLGPEGTARAVLADVLALRGALRVEVPA